jgi:RNA polymerase sigma factor (sigma-70 family)
MRQRTRTTLRLFAGAFAPVLSLDALIAQHDAAGGPSFDIRDDSPSAEERLEQAQGLAAVHDFVDSLPPLDQEIVKRLFWQDETQTQIAASYGVSKMAISKAMARIGARGRQALAAHEHLALTS